jgi:hypothetical protein
MSKILKNHSLNKIFFIILFKKIFVCKKKEINKTKIKKFFLFFKINFVKNFILSSIKVF